MDQPSSNASSSTTPPPALTSINDDRRPAARVIRAAIVLLGIVLGQAVLIGPSLVGARLMLPLDILAGPGGYIVSDRGSGSTTMPVDPNLSDAVFQAEPFRRFAASEFRAGRIPLWNPYIYGGTPFLASWQGGAFSPLTFPSYIWPGAESVAWSEMLKALVAGVGAYLFFRRSLNITYWPATIGAWCFPLTAFMTFWHFSPVGVPVVWLPWLVFLAERTIAFPRGLWGVGLSIATACCMLAGHSAVSSQVMLVSGLFACFRLLSQHGLAGLRLAAAWRSVAALTAAWTLGMLLAAPQLLPTFEYLKESARIAGRASGIVETQPVGLSALPQFVLPFFYGTNRSDSLYLASGSFVEGPATGSAGLILAVVLAPLAWASRRHRATAFALAAIAVFAASQALGLPILARVFELPPLSFFRNNRMVFATGFCLLTLGVIGLDAIWRGETIGKRWAVAAIVPVALAVLCACRASLLLSSAENLSSLAEGTRANLTAVLSDPTKSATLARSFLIVYLSGATLCVISILLWFGIVVSPRSRRAVVVAAAVLVLAEGLHNCWAAKVQSRRDLDFPITPTITALQSGQPGRVCGAACFLPNTPQVFGLHDIRGYDAADPSGMIELLSLARDPRGPADFPHALTMMFVPRRSPILDMLNVRYIVGRGEATSGRNAFWIAENPTCLPRVWAPSSAVTLNDKNERLSRLSEAAFAPRDVAFVEDDVAWSVTGVAGEGRVTQETPTRVLIAYQMQREGLLILADRWAKGWRAEVNGVSTKVLRVNHVLRGVRVPAGDGIIEYRYEPREFSAGLKAAGFAVFALLAWAIVVRRLATPT